IRETGRAQAIDLRERRGQTIDRALERSGAAMGVERFVGGGRGLRAIDGPRRRLRAFLGARAVQARMARDAEDPRAKAPEVARPLAERRHERLVEDVLRFGRLAHERPHEPEERPLEARIEQVEGAHVARDPPLVERLVGVVHAAFTAASRSMPMITMTLAMSVKMSARTTLWSDSWRPSAKISSCFGCSTFWM